MRLIAIATAMWASAIGGATASHAAALRVEPVLIEVFAPGAASTLTLRNDDNSDVNVQIRIFKWSQTNGNESLEPTTDVVASPPAIKISPKSDYVARIVRITKQPVQAEESYRIFVDQLPQTQGRAPGQINVLLRQSIPVFFSPRVGVNANVTWSLRYEGPRLMVTAHNSGDRRLRISSLTLHDGTGRAASFGNGLLGYVLTRSTMNWTAPGQARGFGAAGTINLSAQTDTGPINVVLPPPVRR